MFFFFNMQDKKGSIGLICPNNSAWPKDIEFTKTQENKSPFEVAGSNKSLAFQLEK